MLKVIREYIVYDFTELSEEAKENVRQWYLDDETRPEIFSESIDNFLSENFGKSELKVQYDLGYCQGDGLNIYGKFDLSDMLDKISFDDFSEKEKRFIHWAINNYPNTGKIPANNHYCYCIADQGDYIENLIDDLENCGIRDINHKALEKFESSCIEYFESLCSEFEEDGYKYFYEADDAEIEEACSANDWKFTADGKFFY